MSEQTEEVKTKRGGRKLFWEKMTPERCERLCEALRAGNYIEISCAYAGIHKDTYYKFLERAQKDPPGSQRQEMLRSILKARADAEVRNVAYIQRAAQDPKTWQAAAWWLERSFPTRWGRQQKITQEITGKDGKAIEMVDPREILMGLLGTSPIIQNVTAAVLEETEAEDIANISVAEMSDTTEDDHVAFTV